MLRIFNKRFRNLQNHIDVDIFERVKKEKGNIGQYAKQAHGYFSFPKLEGEIGPRMRFRSREVLNWSLNNYIGLANHPEVRKVDAEAAAKREAPDTKLSLNGEWKFHWQRGLKGEPTDFYYPHFDDSAWRTIRVPSVWQTEKTGSVPYYYASTFPRAISRTKSKIPTIDHDMQEIGHYRRVFTLPKNFEGKEIFLGDCDVVVCDGFVGNVALKSIEGASSMLFKMIMQEFKRDPISMVIGLLAKSAMKRIFKRVNYEEFGGALLLGVKGITVISHGRSMAYAIKNAVRVAKEAVESEVNKKISEFYEG